MKTIKTYIWELGGEAYLKKEDVLKLIDEYIKAQKGTLLELAFKEFKSKIQG